MDTRKDIAERWSVPVLPHTSWPGRQDPLPDQRRFRVIGVLESKGSRFFNSQDNFFFVPFSTFDRYFPWIKNGHEDTIHIATVPKRVEDYQALIEETTAIMRVRRGLRPNQPNLDYKYQPVR